MQKVIIGSNQAGQRFDKFLHKYLPEAGSGFLFKMLRKKNITLNGQKAEGKELLNLGDEINFFFSEETFLKFTGKTSATGTNQISYLEYEKAYASIKGVGVLYEDENILILNKPAGILTQKAEKEDLSLNEWMIGYLLATDEEIRKDLDTFHPSVCNRLDRNTSGIVLCGKSLPGSQALSRIIKDRTLQKYYETICVGKLFTPQTIEGYLCKDNASNKVTILQKPQIDEEASYIQTAYEPICVQKEYTLLEVKLITGKTHQIRAHLSSLGHPIVGDAKYGCKAVNQKLQNAFNLKYQLLHARRIVFPAEKGVLEALSGKTFIAARPALFEKIASALQLFS